MKSIRNIILLIIAAIVLIAGLYFIGILSFSGMFDKKVSREELEKNFAEHEKEFAELEAYFTSLVPGNKEYRISFGRSFRDRVSLNLYPVVVSPMNKIIGGDDLELGSLRLDSALTILRWNKETISILKEKLAKVNCEWISTVDSPHDLISIYNDQKGWGSYSYVIFAHPVSDSVIQQMGKPIGSSNFGRRVFINYTAAL